MINVSVYQLLTTDQAAQFLGLPVSTLLMDRRTARLKIPFYRLGRRILYSTPELAEWLSKQRRNGEAV